MLRSVPENRETSWLMIVWSAPEISKISTIAGVVALTIRLRRSSRPIVVMSMPSMLYPIERSAHFGGAKEKKPYIMLPATGSIILNRDMANVDFPDPVLPT